MSVNTHTEFENKMNGFSTGSGEEDSRDSKRSHDQLCCLIEFDQMIDDGERCPRMAGNASYRYFENHKVSG